LFGIVTARGRGKMVAEALHNRRWISDLRGALTVDVIFEYIQLWDLLENFELQQAVDDTHIWQFSTSGSFTTKSAYETLFTGAIHFSPWERIWQSWAPGKCKFFMWTVEHKKSWIADRLARKGLRHPAACPLL